MLKHLLRLDSIIPRQVKRELLEAKEIPCCEQRDGWKEDPTEDRRRAGISGERWRGKPFKTKRDAKL